MRPESCGLDKLVPDRFRNQALTEVKETLLHRTTKSRIISMVFSVKRIIRDKFLSNRARIEKCKIKWKRLSYQTYKGE